MANYRVAVDLSGLLAANAAIAQAVFPLVGQAVRAVAEEGAYRWKNEVWKAKLWVVEKQAYVESIKWQMTGPMSAEISTDYRLAPEIENGRPARDLKRMLQTSKRVRVSGPNGKHPGQKYLIIPFRHNIPGNDAHAKPMPPGIYKQAKQLSASSIIGQSLRVSGQASPALQSRWDKLASSRAARGAGPGRASYLVPQHIYKWGERLPEGLAPKMQPHHKTDPYAGMVRFNTSAGKGKSSAYLTFRVMTENSTGWIVPAKPGLGIVPKVAQGLQSVLEDAVGQAVSLKSLKL